MLPHQTDVSLSGFQRCQRQMLHTHFKGDILLAFRLDHFHDIIRFQHMAAVINWEENVISLNKRISLSVFYFLRCSTENVCQLINYSGVRRLQFW